MNATYHHLTASEREKLLLCLSDGMSIRRIANMLGRTPSTVSREIRRNRDQVTLQYSACAAEAAYQQRRRKCVRPYLLDSVPLCNKVLRGLEQRWSPEQIAGRLRLETPDAMISYATIYRAIYAGRLAFSRKELRRKGRPPTPHNTEKRGRIHDYRRFSERPEQANTRSQHGHWEGDTVRGALGKGALATFVDRRSSFLVARLMPDRKAATLTAHTVAAFHSFPSELVRTFTVDHGNEFFSYPQIEQQLHTEVYFADPYSPWQRGLNENTNGLLRQYYPKKFDFTKITQQDLDVVVAALNRRPRKKLGFRTPAECFPFPVLHLT